MCAEIIGLITNSTVGLIGVYLGHKLAEKQDEKRYKRDLDEAQKKEDLRLKTILRLAKRDLEVNTKLTSVVFEHNNLSNLFKEERISNDPNLIKKIVELMILLPMHNLSINRDVETKRKNLESLRVELEDSKNETKETLSKELIREILVEKCKILQTNLEQYM